MINRTLYSVFQSGNWAQMDLLYLVDEELAIHPRPDVWSARVSTGLFGLTSCPSGNRGPKGNNEVILALGNEGLEELVELGFITCPTCTPEIKHNFWEIIKETVREKYGLLVMDAFTDKKILNYNARRVDWERILSIIPSPPRRIYLPQDLELEEVREFKQRFDTMGVNLPPVGFYDAKAPSRFTEYVLPK